MKELNYKEIGLRIREKRLENKLTQESLAEKLDISPSYISEIERGTSICSLATIVNIASILNIDLELLVNGITPKNSDSTLSTLLEVIPTKHKALFIKLCKNISETLKDDN